MRIVYDHQIFYQQSYGGISRYFSKLISEMNELQCEVKLFAPAHNNEYLADLPDGILSGHRLKSYPSRARILVKYYNETIAKGSMIRWKPDVLHETYYSKKSIAPKECRNVITVYDMIHEKFRDQYAGNDELLDVKKESVMRADHVICISENTQRDLIDLYGIDEAKTSVVYLGMDPKLIMTDGVKESGSIHLTRPYLLYVGARNSYKNFAAFVHAVSECERLKGDFDIVFFGGGPPSDSEVKMIAGFGFNANQVRYMSGSDDVLSTLYYRASAFVYPSLYEGFGLPPLEAMANNCPVVSSNVSSMPEIIGDAAEYFEPSSRDSICEAIRRVVYSDTRAFELKRLGKLRLNQYSWAKCARETHEIYQRVVG